MEERAPERADRIVSVRVSPDDQSGNESLRPRSLAEFIGQDDLKKRLVISIEAARQRGESVDHVLFSGPPGLGKTTLAQIMGHELSARLHTTSGPAIERAGDLASILTKLEPGDILFIDEIHRINRTVEEVLYTSMEDFKLDITIGKGPSAQTLRIDLKPFTLIGATTRAGLLTAPLRDRFGHHLTLQYYRPQEILQIARRSASILGLDTDDEGVLELARRSRGTPRIANRLLKRVRDYAQVRAGNRLTLPVVRDALDLLGIDELGLDPVDRRLMELLCFRYRGIPVGLKNLAVSLGEDQQTLEEVYEPYLIKIGFLIRSPRGRVASPQALTHFLAREPAVDEQQILFQTAGPIE
ncbi:MAG: Holliday junction branch migration DNA helicase RuvB [Candidatus Riflebacteria bacterium]|nr:Holliday junction branch migration DNA helicase RuvB [Candidatus Riflebacteria bacterium]